MSAKSQLQEIQRRIKRYRIENSVTQKELASMTGISLRSIQRFESGEDISLGNFFKVLEALDLLQPVVDSIPDMDERPSVLLEKYKKSVKKRARKVRHTEQIEFKWGDEE